MTDDRIGERDRVLDGGFEDPYDGDVEAERDRLSHHPYAPLEDAGRVYMRPSTRGIPIDRRCPSCGVDRDGCDRPFCIRYMSEGEA